MVTKTRTIVMEELGKSLAEVAVDVTFDSIEGERKTWDHPGYPPTVELCDVEVLKFETTVNSGAELVSVSRDERPDWFKMLDKTVFDLVEADWDEIQLDLL